MLHLVQGMNMADVEDIDTENLLALLNKYSTELLDPRWIEAMVDTDYTECDAMPPQFGEHHMQTNWVSLLKETGRVCRGFVLQVECRPDASADGSADGSTVDRSVASSVFWTALADHGIRHQSLVALLFYFMFSGQKCDATMDDREEGLLSATVYFLLLAIPGSNAFRVFHPVLYSRALDSFKLVGQLTSRRGSTRKPSRAADDELPVDEDEDELALEPHEAARLLRLLNTVLGDLLLLTERFSLRHGADSLEETVQTLVDVTRLECADGRAGRAVTGVPALAHNSFCGLTNVCRPLHGSVTRSVGLVLRALMPSLLMAGEAAPRALAAVRDRAVRFVGQLVRAAGAVAESPLQTLVQNVCLRVPERAEQRQRAAQSVVLLLALMPAAQRRRALDWLRRFARHEKSGHRLLALELLSRLLAERPRGAGRPAGSWLARDDSDDSDVDKSDTEDDEEEKVVAAERHGGDGGQRTAADDEDGALSRAFLVRQIFARCRDPAATVRARALTVLAECTVSRDAAIRAAVRQLFHGARRRRAASPAQPQEESDSDGDGSDDSDGDMMAMLRRRAKDDKVMVRKSALQVIENVMRLDPDCVTPQNLQVFLEHCRDPALLARKQCQSSLIGLVEEYPGDDSVCEAVVRGLLPQIHDPENKVQDRVVQFVEQTILSGIAPYREGELASAEQQLPWKLLDLVVKLCFQKYLHKIMQAVFTGKKIKPGVCQTLRSHVGTAHNSPAWMCLALISRFSPIEQPLFALEYFTEKIQTDLMTEDVLALQQALYVLQFSVGRLSASAASRLLGALAGLVTAAALPPELIPAAVDTMAMVSFEAGPEDGYRARLDEWCGPLIEDCEDLLTKQLLRPAGGVAPDWEDRLVRQIHTFGDLAQLVPAKVNKRCFLMLQNLIYVEQGKGGSAGGWKSASGLQNPSSRLRSVAIATLGKLCLQHEQMAKRVVPALGKILDVTDEPAIKNNVVFTLSDMCVRYATLVDPLMPQITCCLKDRSLVVRRNCLILLIRLLQEDYLKLKGTFFFRLIQCLVDPEAEIRQLITFYLTERLLKRFPKVFFQHFVECLFLYNEYEDHESYNKLPQTERERKVFALRGPEHRNKRLHIYKVMLEHMPDDQRFQTSHKLCQDILGGLVDGKITLNEVSTQMLHDTLAILSCDEIKLQSLKTRPEDQEPPTDASSMAEVFQAVAKKTLISQVVKKNVIENMVPIIIALKHKLETSRSPLLKELMVFLKDLMKDYKNEIQDILVADKQLAKEIEFDMKRLSEENSRSRAEPPAGPAGDAAAATPRNKHIHSVLVEAIKSAHRLSAGRAARRPSSEAADDDADGADGGAAADQERAPTASNAASPKLSSPAGAPGDLLRAISTPQPGGAVQNLTFLDRDVSAILRLSPVVRLSRPPRGGAETPSGGGGGAEQQGRRDRRSARRGLGSQLAGSAIQEQEEEEERLDDT